MSDLLMRIEALPCQPSGRGCREQLLAGIEDYLFIGGDRLSARQAAERLGVTTRTVVRWRARLRSAGRPAPACGWAACPDPRAHTHVCTYSHVYAGQPAGDVHQITLDLSLACGTDGPATLASSDPAEVTCRACEQAGRDQCEETSQW